MEIHLALLSIGGLMLLGLLADTVGRRTRIPRVTLLILLGVALGAPGLGVLPPELMEWHETLAAAALAMVAFALGGSLTLRTMRTQGRQILVVSLVVALISALLVAGGLAAAGLPLIVALVLGAIATATDPAAMRDVVNQAGGGPFADRLLGIVAIDDAWGLLLFGLLLVIAKSAEGAGMGEAAILGMIGWEIGGAVLVGILIGLPAAYLTGRIRQGEPMRLEALGVVLVCAGVAIWLEVSFLLAGMVAGTLVANLARHHERPFHEIENVQGPFLILFFLLAGATMQVEAIGGVLLACAAFVLLRVAGRFAGGLIGGRLSGLSTREGLWTGAALTPQAGVAIGMALVAGDHFPEHRETIMAVTITTTVFFEIVGPLVTMVAIRKARQPEGGGA